MKYPCVFFKIFALSIVLFHRGAFADSISDTKPSIGDSDGAGKCMRLSEWNRRRGIKTLVIAFEGLASYSPSATRAAYDYHRRILEGSKEPVRLPYAFGGFVARGLMIPVIANAASSFDFLVFPYTATGIAHTCALEWLKVSGRRIILVSHSFGGMATVRVAGDLEKLGIPIHEVITIDPRTPFFGIGLERTQNAKRWENFYQWGGGLPGKSMPDADLNQRLWGAHTGMPFQPAVRQALLSAIKHQ